MNKLLVPAHQTLLFKRSYCSGIVICVVFCFRNSFHDYEFLFDESLHVSMSWGDLKLLGIACERVLNTS